MSKNGLTLPDPKRFNLESFADMLCDRAPIVGEGQGTFDAFRDGLMQSLVPATPYECVIAENLVAIEWELLQQRRMRDAVIRENIREAITDAVVRMKREEYDSALEEAWERHKAAGGTEYDWKETFSFDEDAADEAGAELADRATSRDRDIHAAACEEITVLGMDPVEVMSNAYRSWSSRANVHDDKVQELERRRREVRRDFDALQKLRPFEAEAVEG